MELPARVTTNRPPSQSRNNVCLIPYFLRMPKQYHAQRQHIILSLDALCYQLHTLSFILSPSIWLFLCRLISQLQCSKPRDLEPISSRSLRFFFANIVLLNLSSLWYHATQGTVEGRAVVLDFVGLGYVPSKPQLLILDLFIIFLQLVLTTIAYETSFHDHHMENDTQDVLLPTPCSPLSPRSLSLTAPASLISGGKTHVPETSPAFIIDLRLGLILERLRNPPPSVRQSHQDTSLPLPNTTSWALPPGMRTLLRTSSQIRRQGPDFGPGGSGLPGTFTNSGT